MDGQDLLACQRCTRLKTKCSKEYPVCAQCRKHNVTCIPVPRIRRPRGRNGGRPSEKVELSARIAHLEDLVKSMGEKMSASSSPDKPDQAGDRAEDAPSSTARNQQRLASDTARARQINGQHGSAPMGQSLFAQLSEELVGIREILNDSGEQDSMVGLETDDTRGIASLDAQSSRPWFFSQPTSTTSQAVPRPDEVLYLFEIFRRRVHPLLKTMHMPTLQKDIRSTLIENQAWSSDPHVSAAHAAVLYVAVASLSDFECSQNLGSGQAELWKVKRECVEERLASSCFLTSERLETLQTLIFYLVATRAHDSTRTTWTLLPLAIRIGQALHLHREEHYRSLRPLEAHLRRSIWQCLLTLDFQAAMDRGSDTIITERGSSTKPPIHVDDSEFVSDSEYPLSPSMKLTDMTFFTMASECGSLARTLNFVEPKDMERPPTLLQYDFNARNEAVSQMVETFKQYLKFCEGSEERDTFNDLATVIIATMRLYVVRPLQRHPAMRAPTIMESSVIQLATETISSSVDIYNRSQAWSWYGRQFNSWHSLAVLLAELAVQSNKPVEWEVAKQGYHELGRNIADGIHGPLWVPITKLMRAAEARQSVNLSELVGDGLQFNLNAVPGDMTVPMADMSLVSNVNSAPVWDGLIQPWMYWEEFTDSVARAEDFF